MPAPPRWTAARLVAVAVGGVAGAGLRWAVVAALPVPTFPWPVLLVNVVGSFALGVALAEAARHPRGHVLWTDGAAVGFCGGLTTFSSFAVEVVDLLDDDRAALALAYGAASALLAVGAVLAGALALRSWRAAGDAVEGAA